MKIKWILISCSLLGVIAALLYNVPYRQNIDVTLQGTECRIGESDCEGEKIVKIAGKFNRYLFRPNHFQGSIEVSGYDFFNINKTVDFLDYDGYGVINYCCQQLSTSPFESLGILLFSPTFDEVLLLIHEPVPSSGSKGWSAEDGLFIAAPATNHEEALALAHKLSLYSNWLSQSSWE